MTVSSTTSRVSYSGNGSTTTFSVPFYFLANSHLKVVKLSTLGIETTLTLSTDYTVTGAGVSTGGSITAIVAPLSGDTLTILRNVPYTQETDYQPNDPFPAASHEQALDKLTMETQQLSEQASRALTLPASVGSASTTLPIPSSNKLIGWNQAASALQNIDPTTLATIVAFGTSNADVFTGNGTSTAFILSANPGALNNLDVSIDGVTQTRTTDFTWTTGTTLTFASAPASGAKILVRYLQGLPQGTSDAASAKFIASGSGAVQRVAQDKMRETISVQDFGAVGDGVTDDTAAINAAIAYVASLTGPQYTDTMGQSPYGYGTSRTLKLSGKKYAISSTITLSGNIGIYADGGGFIALSSFSAGSYMLDTGSAPYCGRINDLVLDGNNLNVKGINAHNAFLTRWRGLSVINTRNDAITVQSTGPEFFLTDFDIAISATPISTAVTGLRVLGSDGNYSGGVIKYAPFGVVCNGGGNNTFTGVHPWGTYTGFKMYVGFTCFGSSRNTFLGCYADSPTKQDFTQGNTVTISGVPNGGICFYFDPTSSQNQVIGGRGFISTTLWASFTPAWSSSVSYVPQQLVTSGGVTYCCILANTNQAVSNATYWTAIGTNQFYLGYCAAQYNQFIGVNYNYAGNWLGDWSFSSDSIRDNCLVAGSPTIPNGISAAKVQQTQTVIGSGTYMSVNNTDTSANAASAAALQCVVGTQTPVQIVGNYSAGAYLLSYGAVRTQWSPTQTLFSNSNATEGNLSVQFSDGVGSFAMMALYRNNGGGSPNAAAAAAKFGNNSSTSRSINAAGTINASGADYAEYEINNGLVIPKGAIVGFKEDGTLTLKFSESVRFGVKSTNPSYVGGDSWGTEEALGIKDPVLPIAPPPLNEQATDIEVETYQAKYDQYLTDLRSYDQKRSEFDATLESARRFVDRIAYSGKVPVNVIGASPGQYIIPLEDNDGLIVGGYVSSPSFEQYVIAVGRVNRTLPDGRAEIAIIVH